MNAAPAVSYGLTPIPLEEMTPQVWAFWPNISATFLIHTVNGVFAGTLMVLYGALGSEASMNLS